MLTSNDDESVNLGNDLDVLGAGFDDNQRASQENDKTLDAKNNIDVLSDNQGNFSQLAEEIENKSYVELNHTYYTYDSGSTIIISTDNAVINGKGAIIDMAGSTIRPFTVSASDVTIKNLTIQNANYAANDDGGAIYFRGSGTVENCNFINNKASKGSGGAIDFWGSGTVKNCHFNTNAAFNRGGAINFRSSGTVENCNFIAGAAARSGAISFSGSGTVENCNFIDNTGITQGGAICFGSAGSIHTVKNCNFTNNAASLESDGGAIYFWGNGDVINSNFYENSVKNYGGAVFITKNGTVTNCMFYNNVANEGGAVSSNDGEISADSCIFKTEYDTIYRTHVLSPTLTVDDSQQFIISGKKLAMDLKTNSSMPIYNGNVSISVYYKNNNSWFGNYSCLSGEGWTVDLPAGKYYVVFDTEYAQFKAINKTINVIPDVQFYVNVVPVTTNNLRVNITAKSNIPNDIIEGKLLFVMSNGTELNANDNGDGTWWALHTFDDYGDYNISASFIGLGNVFINNATVSITRANSTINLDDVSLDYGDSLNVTVATEGATGITAKINDDNVTVVDNYTILISGLNAGNYALSVTTIPDGDHVSVSKTVNLTVNKVDSELTINNITFDYNASGSTDMSLTGAAGVNASVIGHDEAVVNVSENAISVSGLDAGKYVLTATTIPDENHNALTRTVAIRVNKANATITSDVDVKDNDVTVNVTVNSSASGFVEFVIAGKKYYAPVNDGRAVLTSYFPAGRYMGNIKYLGDANFNEALTLLYFTVSDPVKLNTTVKCDVSVDGYEVSVVANVNSSASGFVEFVIAGQKYYAPVLNGKAVLDSYFFAGTYSGKVNYLGDEQFNPASTSVHFTVIEQNDTLDNTSIDVSVGAMGNDVSIIAVVNESATGLVEFVIEDSVVYVPVNNGEAVYDVVLPGGNYTVRVTYLGDDKFNANSTSKDFTVTDSVKLNTSISCDVSVDDYEVSVVANVDSSASGFVEFVIAGNRYYAPVNDGRAVLVSDFFAGTYSGKVNYLGDEQFNPASTLVHFTVIEQNDTLDNTSIDVSVGAMGNDVSIIAVVNESATGLVEFVVEDSVVYVPVNNGEAIYDVVLPGGNYTVRVTYLGDDKFNANSTFKDFTVTDPVKLNTTVKCDVSVDDYEVTVVASVDLNASGFVEFVIAGNRYYAPVNDGRAVLVSDFFAGTYSGKVNYLGDEQFNPASTLVHFTVIEQNDTLDNTSIGVVVGAMGNDVSIIASVNGSATGLVEFVIEDSVVYVPVNNGEAVYDVILPGGNYTVRVTYMGDDKFNANSTFKDFTVTDPVKLNTTIKCDVSVDKNNVTIAAGINPAATGFVQFDIDGKVVYIAVNNGNAVYDLVLPSGDYNITATYLGDSKFNSNITSQSFEVTDKPVIVPIASEFSDIVISDDLSISVVLKDANGNQIANAPIKYVINGIANATVTDNDGKFVIMIQNGDEINISYEGNATIIGTSTTLKLNASVPPSVIKLATRFAIDSNPSVTSITINGYAVDTKAGEKGIFYSTVLLDENGNPMANVPMNFAVNNKIYNRTTYENGSFRPYQLDMMRAGRYTMALYYAGDETHNATLSCVCFDLDKKPITIKAAAKTYKVSTKTKKYTVTLKTIVGSSHDGKAHLRSGLKITLKVNGKTFTGKTNSKGKVTFKITNLKKKAKYVAKISYDGDKTYEAATKSVKLTIK